MSKTILFMQRRARATCDGAKWDESKHKRDQGGKFSSTGSGGGKKEGGAKKAESKAPAKREERHDTKTPPDERARRWLEKWCSEFESSARKCKTKSDIRSLANSFNYERPLWAKLAIRKLASKFMEELDKAKR